MKKAEMQEQEFLLVCSSYDYDLLTGKSEMTLKDHILQEALLPGNIPWK